MRVHPGRAACCVTAGLFLSLAAAQATLTVTVILNKPEAGGMVHVALCSSREAYDKDQGCIAKSVEVAGNVVSVTFSDLAPGTFAVKAFHDLDGDGELKTSWLGWPKEPHGFSNDAPVNQGQPPFKLAAIEVKAGTNTARIALRGG
jgi:uncharacterized protein (DUF2141 family)